MSDNDPPDGSDRPDADTSVPRAAADPAQPASPTPGSAPVPDSTAEPAGASAGAGSPRSEPSYPPPPYWTPSGPPPFGPPPPRPPSFGQPPPGSTAPLPAPAPPQARHRLSRSRHNRVLAGVAGGLGEYAGIDPVVFRVLFAVLTLFGGAGALLYLVGWLFLPDEGEPASPAESLIGRGRAGLSPVETVLLAIAAFVLAVLVIRGDGGDLALLAVVVVVVLLVVRNLDDRRRGGSPPPGSLPPPGSQVGPPAGWSAGPPPGAPFGPPVGSTPGPPGPSPGTSGYPPPAWPAAAAPVFEAPALAGRTSSPPSDRTGDAGQGGAPDRSGGYPAGPYPGGPAGPQSWYGPPPPPPPPRPARERSVLGRVTLSIVLVALGVLAALDSTDVLDLGPRHYLGLALAVVGVGLLVGAWFGRARWLVAIGIPLTVLLVGASTAGVAFRGGTGDRQIRPIAASDVRSSYELGTGNLTLDLTGVDFVDRSIATKVRVGVGNVQILLPREVDAQVRARSGVGELQLFDQPYNGLTIDHTVTDNGPDGPGGGRLALTLNVGIGRVEVARETS